MDKLLKSHSKKVAEIFFANLTERDVTHDNDDIINLTSLLTVVWHLIHC